MKKTLLIPVLASLAFSSYAFNITLKSKGLNDNDLISFVFNTVAGDCKVVDGKYNCQVMNQGVEGLPLSYTKEFFDEVGNRTNERLAELSFKINEQGFLSCQHLESKGQDITVTLTPAGCV